MKAIEATVALSMPEAENAVRCALAEHGFGVLTEIDVAATLKAKLDVDRPPLKILGACNPPRAPGVAARPVGQPAAAVQRRDRSGRRGHQVAAVDPHEIMHDARFAELADDAAGRLRAAVESVASRCPRPHTQPGTEDLRTYRNRPASGMPDTEGRGDASDDHTHHNPR